LWLPRGVVINENLSTPPQSLDQNLIDEYVTRVHTGYAISVVDEAEALESLRLLQELAESYPVEELFNTTGGLSLVPAGSSGS
jgi:hydrogenase maturation factor